MNALGEVISLDGLGLNVAGYRKQEIEILQPRLEELGYIFISWHDGERDSFGALTRICRAMAPNGEMVEFYYV